MQFVRQRRGLLLVMLIAALAVGAWVVIGRNGAALPPNAVRVTRGAINATIEAVGKVRPVTQAQLSLRLGGRVAEVNIRLGDKVDAGQVLLTLDPAPFERDIQTAELDLKARQQRLDQARAGAAPSDVEAAQAAVREATVARAVAQAGYDERAKKPDAATSAEAATLESAKAAFQRARAQLERALMGASPEELAVLTTQVAQGQLALDTARKRLEDTRLTAPFAGVALEVIFGLGRMWVASRLWSCWRM